MHICGTCRTEGLPVYSKIDFIFTFLAVVSVLLQGYCLQPINYLSPIDWLWINFRFSLVVLEIEPGASHTRPMLCH